MIERMTIAEIRSILRAHESGLAALRERKEALLAELEDVDREIARLEGKRGKRVGNPWRKFIKPRRFRKQRRGKRR